MKVTGIICELNPPHAGHRRLFDFARREDGRALIAVMSGNFVQRGEPAVFSKHSRASAALEAGIDLVIELPVPYALSSAEGFASAAVGMLRLTGIVDTLAFGAECGDIALLRRAALALELPECGEMIRGEMMRGTSYARACQIALGNILGDDAKVLEAPNNMLAIQYLRALRDTDIDAVCLKREPGISASGIRSALRAGEKKNMLPAGDMPYGKPMFPENLEIAMLSRIRALPESAFYETPGSSDGIAERAMRFSKSAGSAEELAFEIKTKRHTLSRVRRYLMCLALGIADEHPALPPYARVLGVNETGRALLKSMDAALAVITKPAGGREIGGAVSKLLELEAASTDFYNLGHTSPELRAGGAEWRISPAVKK